MYIRSALVGLLLLSGCPGGAGDQLCGNGLKEGAEACDDGNTTSGDGCSANCQGIEGCGDGIIDVGDACDDGNTVNGDGCDNNCTFSSCGNNASEPTEVCLTAQQPFSVSVDPNDIAVADMDNDGDLDLVVSSITEDNISILPNNGDGTFGARSSFPVGNSPIRIAIGDLDDNGTLDVITANAEDNL